MGHHMQISQLNEGPLSAFWFREAALLYPPQIPLTRLSAKHQAKRTVSERPRQTRTLDSGAGRSRRNRVLRT